jgi:hypothetical protein
MRRRILTTFASLAVAAAAVPATAALAQTHAPTTVPKVELKGAYAFVDAYPPSNKPFAAVVFRTAHQLPRRFDGMIRAGGSLDGGHGGSVGSVRGAHAKAGRHCYTFLVPMKDGRLRSAAHRSVRAGTHHTLTVTARGPHGDVKDSIRLTFEKKAAGDRSGKPLSC